MKKTVNPRPSIKYLTDEEAYHLESMLPRFSEKDMRNCCMIWLSLYTGARPGEILELRRKDLNAKQKTLYIKGNKGSTDRELPLPKWLVTNILSFAPESGKIFPISYLRLYQVWVQYRPAKKPFKALRHTFASRLYRKTKDLRMVQVALGHKAADSTLIYTAYEYSTCDLRQAMFSE